MSFEESEKRTYLRDIWGGKSNGNVAREITAFPLQTNKTCVILYLNPNSRMSMKIIKYFRYNIKARKKIL